MGRVKADAGRKYRAYPTEVQDQVLTRWGHTARALWNVALEQRVYLWEQRR
ncbi:helix-turn-helix domain-containing protein [Streptomyces sp. NPDC059533]